MLAEMRRVAIVMDDNFQDGNALLASRSIKRVYRLYISILIGMFQ